MWLFSKKIRWTFLTRYFSKFGKISFSGDHIIIKTDITQYVCLEDFKENQLLFASGATVCNVEKIYKQLNGLNIENVFMQL